VRVGIRSVDFRRGGFNADPLLADALAGRTAPVPPGWARGYTTMVDSLDAAVDTRRPEAAGGSGVRVEADASYQGDLRQVGSWLNYGGAAGGFLDLNDHGRVISLSVSSHFADPVGHASIPFTELVQLGGFSPMRAFYQGRLADRSAAVAELAYHWPIWVWLDGAMRFEVGNVFGAHLHDFAPGLLRFSGSVGIESRQSSDNSLQLLFGLGSETFASGARLDAVRLVVGTTHGF
jgi:hypothetical protein